LCPPGTACNNGVCETECPWDLDGDGVVAISDFLLMLGNWGDCPP